MLERLCHVKWAQEPRADDWQCRGRCHRRRQAVDARWSPGEACSNRALHAASGILIAIVAVELIPNALDVLAGWWLAAAFAAGGLTYIALQAGVERLQSRQGGEGRTGMWMIYIAVAIDLASDGVVLGAGSAVSLSLALVLASGQILADVPEGYASIASFRSNDVPRAKRLWLSASFVTFCTAGATLAYFGLRGTGRAGNVPNGGAGLRRGTPDLGCGRRHPGGSA